MGDWFIPLTIANYFDNYSSKMACFEKMPDEKVVFSAMLPRSANKNQRTSRLESFYCQKL